MAAMKVNSSSTPVKKSAGSGSVGSSARKCDQLKIKLVQVRPGALLESRPHTLRRVVKWRLDFGWTGE